MEIKLFIDRRLMTIKRPIEKKSSVAMQKSTLCIDINNNKNFARSLNNFRNVCEKTDANDHETFIQL